MRARPVVSFAGRYARKPFTLGSYRLPVGTRILLAAILTHYDPKLFPHPERFEPDRFLDVTPDTYSWIPFGGGIRRCIGASFALMEMDVVLRVLLERVELQPSSEPDEQPGFRGVVWVPASGAKLVIRHRVRERSRAGQLAAA
jgi:cytochrome P450